MNKCPICNKIYDTDFQMEVDEEGNCICNDCFECITCCDCNKYLDEDRRMKNLDDMETSHGICFDCEISRDEMPGGFGSVSDNAY